MVNNGVRVEERARWQVAYRDGFICWLCEQPVDMFAPHNAINRQSLDHLQKRESGGRNTQENLRLTHALCNSRRDVLPLKEIRALETRYHERIAALEQERAQQQEEVLRSPLFYNRARMWEEHTKFHDQTPLTNNLGAIMPDLDL